VTVPYPEYPPPGYGPPMPPYYPAPQRKSRTGLWIGLAAVVVLAIVAITVTTVFLLTRKRDITELTASMLLPESDFPSLEAAEFVDEPVAEDDEYDFDPADVDPAECFYVVEYPHATQATSKSVTNDDGGFTVKLRINDEWPDLKKIVAECDARAIEFADLEGTVRAVDHPELPDWAVAVALDTDEDQFVYVSGYYRGVQVDAEYFGRRYTKSDLGELVRMFNLQVDRLSEQ
jgi:hypothetical protein